MLEAVWRPSSPLPVDTVGERLAAARTRVWLALIFVLATMAAVMAVLALFPHNMYVPLMLLAAVCLPAVLWRRPVVGVYLLVAAAVLVEENRLHYSDSFTDNVPFFHDLSGLVQLHGLYVNPAELLIVATAAALVLKTASERRFHLELGALFWPFTIYMSAVSLGVLYGISQGGSIRLALWEVRAQFYAYAAYLLVVNLVRDRGQAGILVWVTIAGVAAKGIVGSYRYLVTLHGNLGQYPPGMNSLMAHEESFFFVALIMMVVAFWWFAGQGRQRRWSILLLVPVIVALLANQRRAAILALLLGLIVLAILAYAYLPDRRRLLLWMAAIAFIALPIYTAAFANAGGLLGEPGRALRTRSDVNPHDRASNVYRLTENANTEAALRANLVTGLGYGRPIPAIYTLPAINSPFADLIPHNTILWVWARIGSLGFAAFWFFIGSAFIYGTRIVRETRSRYYQGLAALATAFLAAHLMISFLDQELVNFRPSLFVGAWLGLLTLIPRFDADDRAADGDPPQEAGT